MKVLILGGSGFLGKNISKVLCDAGHKVFSFDLAHDNVRTGITYIDGDFFTYDIFSLIDNCDCVIHAICTISTSNCKAFYLYGYQKDFIRTVEIFDYCSKKSKKIMFLSSGGTVYGDTKLVPTKEEQPLCPRSHYGALKASLEHVAHAFNVEYGINIISLRISNPYGPGQDYKKGIGFIDAVLKKSLNNEEILIFGKGDIVRDYIYINDVALAVLSLVESDPKYECINIGTGIGTSQNQIVDFIKKIGLDPKVDYGPSREFDVPVNILDNSKLREFYKGTFVSVDEGIKSYLNYIRETEAKNEN